MKKAFMFFTSVIVILSFVTPAYANTSDNPLVVSLVAGQNKQAGYVKAWDDGKTLYVSYETIDPWCLTETHLAVADSLGGIPQANGNPIPGQFPYKNTHKCVTSYLYQVPLIKNVCELYITAHAVVKSRGSTETAWGNGSDFPGKNWATYFVYEVSDCNVVPTPTESETVTPTPPTPTETATVTPPTPTETATETPPTPTETSTLTSTPTETVTPTTTPPVCQPTVVTADFSQIAVGQSVEGMGVVAPGLNIDAIGTAVKIQEGVQPAAYGAPNDNPTSNGGLASGGGFSDVETRDALQAHHYTFTFATGVSVSNFSLHMLDFGDWNTTASASHDVSITAYDANGFIVSRQEINYTTPAVGTPRSSSGFGDVWITGDAVTSSPGELGNWTWRLGGSGIVEVVLDFGAGYDPAIGFDTLSFTTQCP